MRNLGLIGRLLGINQTATPNSRLDRVIAQTQSGFSRDPDPMRQLQQSLPFADEVGAAIPAPNGLTLFSTRLANPDIAAPFNVWVQFTSTWTHRAYFEENAQALGQERKEIKGSLYVEFIDGAMVRYDNVPAMDWQDFFSAPSHGKYLYNFVIRNPKPWSKPYALLREATRPVTKELLDKYG